MVLFASLLVVAVAAGGAARASVEGAAQFIRQVGAQAIETLQAPDLTLEQREVNFRHLLYSPCRTST